MEKHRKNRCAEVSAQVAQMRKLYSQIGEPLPVDVIIDLHRHLGKALEIAEEKEYAAPYKTKKACVRSS